ncbi:hypothetical protein GGQ54_001883 [Naumannella cuiyingiana]|uniref:Uncharacterized protein n=1 Tax=Naumannella cuiyingiana TaxID=1347891 RepID=A0A7Z0D9T8_9ACTN|nr:hypothetical protein [Naumannella cuiyingiana]
MAGTPVSPKTCQPCRVPSDPAADRLVDRACADQNGRCRDVRRPPLACARDEAA